MDDEDIEPFKVSMQRIMAPIPPDNANECSMNSELSPSLYNMKNILDRNLRGKPGNFEFDDVTS